ncbi:thiamine biosynthesis protein ApbE [Mergibacter septicus]|uniref:FAD:protein FMN transferase n=1 Tax=Mergibacter septicus TaxID=221402 RepID=A0A8E3MDW8_9PAST|nr:FAD:protein FMN transferase [Mergibacter septicus]AWX16103.1 thiamine biosynthesis protein ApbE [Mergibacter septicus]QDJ13557.1 thiamine biosynthesis protein ApbE [Mergibacter septicus]QDJ15356.1 thiamine biosynthesis protein ApbE [Mergibacter septicus]UTU48775.1 FAD:protein FMN transferase [Mergibacter septicus]WMR95594.1 FAD:protein FMN transferase [Mergibacter septicus]
MLLKKLTHWLALIGLAFFLIGCGDKAEIVSLSGKTMGTTYHIKYIDNGSNVSMEKAHEEIDLLLKEVNNQMSTYQKDSELSLFNQYEEIDKPFPISADFAKVVKEAIRLNKITEGALDITVGPLVNLWGFGPEKQPDREPTQAQIDERKAWTGIDKLSLIEEEGKAKLVKHIPQLYVDLSSIAKGFGVDKVGEYLESIGINNYLVEIGGEIRARGVNEKGLPWQIAIEKPEFDGSRVIEQIIGLKDATIATSGDYRNYFEENGKRFSHEIDPTTGYPILHRLASISVIAPSCMTADGYATGLYVLGADKALEIAEQQNLAIYLIIMTDKGFEVKMSSAFKKILETSK